MAFYDSSSDSEDTPPPIVFDTGKEVIPSLTQPSREDDDDDDHTKDTMAPIPVEDSMKELHVPTHPISSMQGAFAESMVEVAGGASGHPPKNTRDAVARRKYLLGQDIHEETHASKWRQKPGQQYHELWKLMAQTSFGIYLLLNGIAKDEDQVMSILQGHVDEVDEFLETTLEDFDLAQNDIDERLKLLKLPLQNIHIFDAMLEDRTFRSQIVTGNESIEHVITRTAAAMNDALKDVQQGLDAVKEFTIYLARAQDTSMRNEERTDMKKVFQAMKGNVEGWYKAYVSLQTKGNHLAAALVQLGSIVAEMDKRAADISRKQRFSIPSTSSTPSSPAASSRQSRQMRLSMLRELPTDPSPITPAIRAALPAFQMVQDRERTPEPKANVPSSISKVDTESSGVAEPEPDFILKPHTYSPVPSPKPQTPRAEQQSPVQQPLQEKSPPPEVRQRTSLRNRFSLKRKETPSEVTLKAPPTPTNDNYWGPRQRVQSASKSSSQEQDNNTVNSPSSRGLDSAYCSDYEKPSPSTTLISTPMSNQFNNTPPIPPRDPGRNAPGELAGSSFPTPPLTQDSPRSDRQFFRPVNASPHSPLQRPWTAAPSNIMHIHSNSSSSNLSNLRYGHTHTPSQLGDRGGAPSTMGMTIASEMTTMTEGGRKVKKKRSAFGWLKKAFSLSEEEKAAFEERTKARDQSYRQGYYETTPRKWVDGKRIR
ncbi:uncharacterized protein BP5553_08729 [Venustampulla echinocandica]|uniref:Uncharacterized protein n=1 Tax=Venustampulla echinocandica TaxID=2656787 RepID=A0A370TF59_9HELO|nr:uncharacterized protein BP5553_08729 [Venustampulla echinocandica]RDL33290.1 hypothetical protein BP5553_08729 [Venustampulla echinocandica]